MEQELSKITLPSEILADEDKIDVSDEETDDELDVLKEPSKTTSASKKKTEKKIEEGIFTKENNFIMPLPLK